MAQDQKQTDFVHPDREQLFGNEAFAIGMLQVVSGGSVIAAISQVGPITEYSGKVPFLIFITIMAFALLCAVFAAYWRHQYKMWDVKRDVVKANKFLWAMRYSMLTSVVLVTIGVLWLVWAFWYAELCVA